MIFKERKKSRRKKKKAHSSSSLVIASESALRESVQGLALLPPVLGPCARGLRAVRKGQVGGDAVPDAIAQHAVVAVVVAGQLSSAEAGQKEKRGEF